jgi:hypothetical protein
VRERVVFNIRREIADFDPGCGRWRWWVYVGRQIMLGISDVTDSKRVSVSNDPQGSYAHHALNCCEEGVERQHQRSSRKPKNAGQETNARVAQGIGLRRLDEGFLLICVRDAAEPLAVPAVL